MYNIVCIVNVHVYMCCHDYTRIVHVPQFHEYVHELVTEHHTTYHPLHLLNGHTFGHTQVSQIGQKPDMTVRERNENDN